jgi:hypothetical protein
VTISKRSPGVHPNWKLMSRLYQERVVPCNGRCVYECQLNLWCLGHVERCQRYTAGLEPVPPTDTSMTQIRVVVLVVPYWVSP